MVVLLVALFFFSFFSPSCVTLFWINDDSLKILLVAIVVMLVLMTLFLFFVLFLLLMLSPSSIPTQDDVLQ